MSAPDIHFVKLEGQEPGPFGSYATPLPVCGHLHALEVSSTTGRPYAQFEFAAKHPLADLIFEKYCPECGAVRIDKGYEEPRYEWVTPQKVEP